MRQLVIDRRICCCSQFMIFLLELLGQAIGCLAGPSSSNRKIMNWQQQQILLSTTDCPILPVLTSYFLDTGKMIQLVVVRRICCCSQSMIFLLELLGPAIGCLAGPSSSNRKLMDWEQQQILLSTTNCLILAVGKLIVSYHLDLIFSSWCISLYHETDERLLRQVYGTCANL